ncbi:MAG: hypothetical protein CVU17_03980 [Betaproteobacteria bacterium HGW-Betaproteobacteria-11]|nr:MAG: hypothetical protein CVU17_03980 [Betaproteobacteria bacterium HGW-Betaproteobacteria-11]
MNEKVIRFWDRYPSWEAAEADWQMRAEGLRAQHPLRELKKLPNLPGIRPKTRKNLRWKAIKYLAEHDVSGIMRRFFFSKPLRNPLNLLRSMVRKKPYVRDGDFFFYGFNSEAEFRARLQANPGLILVVGFSYCHKPFECPSGRFSDQCQHDPEHPVCGQCFIGKCVHSLPVARTVPAFIPTVHYISEKMLETVTGNPGKEVLFVITACELTLEMFADGGNMAGFRGIGVRLDGLICNTMRAFEVSEVGIKPGLTVVLDETQKRMMELFALRRHLSQEHPRASSPD